MQDSHGRATDLSALLVRQAIFCRSVLLRGGFQRAVLTHTSVTSRA